jgi:CelD/BcsL family acetyltransferase involved in cellulose biosynthesis
VEVVRDLAEGWRRLCHEDPACEPFYRPEWAEAYVLAFAPKCTLIVISAWSGGRLRGVLPLIKERIWLCGLPVRRIAFPANMHCCRAGLVACPGPEREVVLEAMWQALRSLGGWDLLDFDGVLEGNGIDHFAARAEADGLYVARKPLWQSIFLSLTPGAEGQAAWQSSLRPNLRSNLRRRRRQLEELGSVTLRRHSTADRQTLEQFYRVESSGWKGQDGIAISCNPRTRLFYDTIARAAGRGGYLALDFLDLEGKPIAAHFAFNVQGRYFLVKAGYDETYSRYSPGHLLVHEVLAQGASRGLRELDFVGPAAWHETRWASQRRDHSRVFIFRDGRYGSMLHALRIMAWDAVKHRLAREQDESLLAQSES